MRIWMIFPLLAFSATACTSGRSFAPPPAPAETGTSSTATCGVPGKPCCLGNECLEGGCCVKARCVAEGTSCGEEVKGTCRSGGCGDCGRTGQACCQRFMPWTPDKAATCTAPRATCTGDEGGQCVTCGGEGQRCCAGYECLAPGTGCLVPAPYAEWACVRCGEPGERCCGNGACRDGGCCLGKTCVAQGSECGCRASQCTTCGAENLACCSGERCMPPNMCLSGKGPSDKVCLQARGGPSPGLPPRRP